MLRCLIYTSYELASNTWMEPIMERNIWWQTVVLHVLVVKVFWQHQYIRIACKSMIYTIRRNYEIQNVWFMQSWLGIQYIDGVYDKMVMSQRWANKLSLGRDRWVIRWNMNLIYRWNVCIWQWWLQHFMIQENNLVGSVLAWESHCKYCS